MSTYVSVVISPATTTRPVVISVSQATRPSGSSVRTASSTESEIWSAILSGWPSVTDSEVKEKLRFDIPGRLPNGRSYSSVGSRPINRAASSVMLWPERTAHTPSVIGSSTPSRCERSRRIGAVVTPSTVWPISATARSGVSPCAISSPACRFRPCRLQHVPTRSPMPASPANVSARAPAASPSRVISARPRAMREAFALSPSLSPSTPPAARAITFFAAAQSSTPTRSGLTYARKRLELSACWSCPARNPSSLAITAAVGSRSAISCAKFGPARTATGRPRTRVERRSPVCGSSPFARLSTGASPAEALAQPVLDPVAVVARDESRVVDEEAEPRGAYTGLRAVEEVEPPAARPARRLPGFAELGERAVQLGRRDPDGVPVEELGDPVEQALEAAAGVRRHGDERRPLAQAPAELAAGVVDADRRRVPFREDA